ncbi:uncharacterized protein L199_005741 [Kwoniella botswanensis]|uniref:uncharacterized protein n=1 Tax=Kwoniella botswanensis TaxID=1268659 RepID=UPI00315CD966
MFILPPPSDNSNLDSRPTSIELTIPDKRIWSHNEAMTQAIAKGDPFSQALVSSVQAIDNREIPVSKIEIDTLVTSIDSHIQFIQMIESDTETDVPPPVQSQYTADLENIKKLIRSGYRAYPTDNDKGILSISLRSPPELQQGKTLVDPEGASRLLITVERNSGFREYRFNAILSQICLGRSLSHHEQVDLMPPSFLTEMNKYMVHEGFRWTNRDADGRSRQALPKPSEVLYHNDPWSKRYERLSQVKALINGTSYQEYRSLLESIEILPEGEKLLLRNDIKSVSDASRARAIAALGDSTSDPGPTWAEHLRSQDPLEFAIEALKYDYTEEEIDFSDPEVIRPFMPHRALEELSKAQSN